MSIAEAFANAPGSELGITNVRAPMSTRLADVGETTMVAPETLKHSNFQSIYRGDGKPRRAEAEEVVQAVLNFGEELAVPTYLDQLKLDAEYSKTEDVVMPALEKARQLPAMERIHTYAQCFSTMAYSDGFTPGVQRKDLPASREAATKLTSDFDLRALHGPAQLYTSESTVAEVQDWTVKWDSYGFNRPFGHKEQRKMYKAVNKVIGEDDHPRLVAIMPYIRNLNYHINETRHAKVTVYSGVSVGSPGRALLIPGEWIRIPRILSTSADKAVAVEHVKDLSEELKGLLLVINIPEGFWGARVISDISVFEWEKETLFPPYSQFEVLPQTTWRTQPPEIHLAALDKYAGFD